jgi:hypothetical protein
MGWGGIDGHCPRTSGRSSSANVRSLWFVQGEGKIFNVVQGISGYVGWAACLIRCSQGHLNILLPRVVEVKLCDIQRCVVAWKGTRFLPE